MRASAVLFTLFAALAAAAPGSPVGSVDVNSLIETRQCAAAGACSKGGDKGESCSALKCCSNSKSGRGNSVS
ncbi:hypothetical protein CMUS01_03710 [Colletotrichum musicola]|uniref:Uncharacterized protein n=1 Tax=Colletotrichum musicola TaxID=2175873 RepID=A0A8H6U5I1_9PEZI|nr:hypothetical protein CMUS01_03710 [Colletotrichum musicola]